MTTYLWEPCWIEQTRAFFWTKWKQCRLIIVHWDWVFSFQIILFLVEIQILWNPPPISRSNLPWKNHGQIVLFVSSLQIWVINGICKYVYNNVWTVSWIPGMNNMQTGKLKQFYMNWIKEDLSLSPPPPTFFSFYLSVSHIFRNWLKVLLLRECLQ